MTGLFHRPESAQPVADSLPTPHLRLHTLHFTLHTSPLWRHALELLFTGEAKHYLKTENNLHDWIAELQRLVGQLGEVGRRGVANLADLMASPSR
jgi:hypothetical protein